MGRMKGGRLTLEIFFGSKIQGSLLIHQDVTIFNFDWSILANSMTCKGSKFEEVKAHGERWYPGRGKWRGGERFGRGRGECVHVQIGALSISRLIHNATTLARMLSTLDFVTDLNVLIVYGVEHQLKNHMFDFVRELHLVVYLCHQVEGHQDGNTGGH